MLQDILLQQIQHIWMHSIPVSLTLYGVPIMEGPHMGDVLQVVRFMT